MGAHRNPEVSRKVERARELLAADPDRPLAGVAREVGLPRPTLVYRLEQAEPDAVPADSVGDAEIPVFEIDYSDRPKHTIYPIGDLHIGSPEHAETALDGWLDYIRRTANVSMLNTGDNTNCALSSSVSDEYGEKLTVREARERQTEKFKPIADRIDLIIDGNHEDRVYRSTGDSPNAAVADALGINYDRAGALVRYHVGDVSYDVYLRHGSGGGSTMGAQVNQLEKQERVIHADIYVSGHTHTQLAFVKDVFIPNKAATVDRTKRLFVCSGSFVGYEEYARKAGYPPAHIGAPRVFLDGRRKDAHASV